MIFSGIDSRLAVLLNAFQDVFEWSVDQRFATESEWWKFSELKYTLMFWRSQAFETMRAVVTEPTNYPFIITGQSIDDPQTVSFDSCLQNYTAIDTFFKAVEAREQIILAAMKDEKKVLPRVLRLG